MNIFELGSQYRDCGKIAAERLNLSAISISVCDRSIWYLILTIGGRSSNHYSYRGLRVDLLRTNLGRWQNRFVVAVQNICSGAQYPNHDCHLNTFTGKWWTSRKIRWLVFVHDVISLYKYVFIWMVKTDDNIRGQKICIWNCWNCWVFHYQIDATSNNRIALYALCAG